MLFLKKKKKIMIEKEHLQEHEGKHVLNVEIPKREVRDNAPRSVHYQKLTPDKKRRTVVSTKCVNF